MSNASTKAFDAVQMVRAIRDDLSARIATMSVDDENRWLRSADTVDATLQRLMALAAQQGAAADAASRRS